MSAKSCLKITLMSSLAFALSACGNSEAGKAETPTIETSKPVVQMDPLQAAISGKWRGDQAARDVYRNPSDTLKFFGLAPGMTVMEISPGTGGWYTGILAPYAQNTDGQFIAAVFDESLGERYAAANKRFSDKFADTAVFGSFQSVQFGAGTGPLADQSVDLILSFRNVHSWMGRGYADKAFADFYGALKPGGILGVVEHRLPESAEQNSKAPTGYVQVSYTKALAKEAGFEYVGSSEVNANPKDTADHPFGVWTLPPSSRTAARGEEPAADFDAAKYLAIGESDRYTLKFRKPK